MSCGLVPCISKVKKISIYIEFCGIFNLKYCLVKKTEGNARYLRVDLILKFTKKGAKKGTPFRFTHSKGDRGI